MNYKFLGQTGVKVSAIAYGTMSFGGDADEAGSAALFRRCRDAGINFFDCANIYAGGPGRGDPGPPHQGLPRRAGHHQQGLLRRRAKDVNATGASRRHIMHAVEASLRRLQTDRIDVYFLHRFDDRTPLEETLRALDDLVRQGKILYTGASNFAAWQVAKALGISAQAGPGRRSPASSPCTTWSSARPKWRSCPWPSPRGWASSPTAPWAAAC